MTDATQLTLAVLKRVATLLDKLSEEQLTALATGAADLAFVAPETTVRASRRATTPRVPKAPKPTVDMAAARLGQLTDRDAAVAYLTSSGLTGDELKAVASRLRITTPSRPKAAVIERLAEGAVGYRSTYQAVLGRRHEP